MDNRLVNITSVGEDALAMAIRIIWPNCAGQVAKHYKIVNLAEKVEYFGEPTTRHYTSMREDPNGTPTLILLWHEERGSLPLPYELDVNEAVKFVEGWLNKVPRGSRPDMDGDSGNGWNVFTDLWGHVAGHHYAFVGIQPAWALYGK